MDGLAHLAGPLALAILCAVLFIEEAGLPVPVLPGDALLVGAGILIAENRISWAAYVPAASLAMIMGALIGFAWTRRAGPAALRGAARLMRCGSILDRGAERLRGAGAGGVFVSRNLPGMRVYTNMLAGAAQMRPLTFVMGMVPAVLTWVVGFGLLGDLAGRPVLRVIARVDAVASVVAVALAATVVLLVAARFVPGRRVGSTATAWSGAPLRALGAIGIDLSAVAIVVLTIRIGLSSGREAHPFGMAVTTAIAVAAVAVYVICARRLAGATVGERLLGVVYPAAAD